MQNDAKPTASVNTSRSTTWWMISAVFMAAVLVALVAVLIGTRRPSVTPAVSVSTSTETAPAADCPVRAGSQEVPTQQLPGVTWTATAYGVMLPYSSTFGPTKVDASSARCFSHDPAGAVMAASHIGVRGIQDPDTNQARRVIESQMMPGPARDQLLTTLLAARASQSPQGPWQWLGFRVLSYSGKEAVVMLAQGATGTNAISALTYPLTWDTHSGDWKVNLENAQGRPISRTELNSEFTPWGKVN